MKLRLCLILTLLFIALPSFAQTQQVTNYYSGTEQVSTIATQYGNSTIILPVQIGVTSHQFTFITGPSVTGITVTVSTSTSGTTYATCGSSSSLGATITCSNTTAATVKIVITNYAGSGPVDGTYYGTVSDNDADLPKRN